MELVFLLFSLCIFPYWSLMEPLSLWSLLLQNCSKLAESDHCSGFLVNALAWSTTNWKITILLKVHRSESWSEQRYCRSKGSIGQDPRTKKWSDRPLTERSDLDLRADRSERQQSWSSPNWSRSKTWSTEMIAPNDCNQIAWSKISSISIHVHIIK